MRSITTLCSWAIERNLCKVGLSELGELASSFGHLARQPPQFVFYAGKHLLGWGSPARCATFLDRAADVIEAELTGARVLIATDEVGT